MKYASILITLLTATLYTLGLTYYQGYLRTLGIDETQFPLTFDKTLFHGFVSSMLMGAPAIKWLLFAAESVLVIAAIGTFLINLAKKRTLPEWITRKLSKVASQVKDTENQEETFFQFSMRMFLYSVVVFLVFIGILLLVTFSDKGGQEAAMQFRGKIERGQVNSTDVVFKDSRNMLTGFLITCNQSQCAYLVGKETVVINISDVESTTTKK